MGNESVSGLLNPVSNTHTNIDIDVDGPMTLGNTNLMVDAALAGIGIAWVPNYHIAEHLASGRLVHRQPVHAWRVPLLSGQSAPSDRTSTLYADRSRVGEPSIDIATKMALILRTCPDISATGPGRYRHKIRCDKSRKT
ncbi:LysR substrate-binding domain-containing protein [Dyella tabacisoli]|uniref:LysR substrate-binding domain-containing protein n=1 Tax=Dyella tabacisoli TaxID=2282381 RepID=UPI001CDC1D98